MKKVISEILEKYVEVYAFVPVSEYLAKRNSLGYKDVFKVIENINDYQTIITLGISYPSEEITYSGRAYGLLSRYSYNIDYHIVFGKILKSITSELENLGIKHFASVDVSEIDERLASYLANIGFLGKNQFLINKKYGSYLFLATILIDQEISKNENILDDCGDCKICLDACPTSALDYGFDASLCLSGISQEKKEFSESEIGYFNKMVYGCDVCQKVCPKNLGVNFHIHPEFESSGIENIDLLKLLEMSNKEYYEVYGDNASSWKGPLVIKRNALCLLANQNIFEAIPIINKSIDNYQDVLWYNKTAKKVLKLLERK